MKPASRDRISYRFARRGDLAMVVKIRLEFLTEAGQHVAQARALPRTLRAYFIKSLRTGEFVGALAESKGEPVGFAGMVLHRRPPRADDPTGLYGYVLNVYVSPGYRRRGLATKLLKMLAAKAKKLGCRCLRLHHLPGARPLYAKIGYALVKTEMKLDL